LGRRAAARAATSAAARLTAAVALDLAKLAWPI